ncbi:HTH-type transcriptional repressor YvoA [Micromonospora sp. MH33]|uniref:GntR family transcriptional regulator n=1 Tax=Micromonospora sp. MH33 TaxID=1945509 RepID=UPI000D14875B|nr:GntR family transcriptional regulator [Micromonospora sp. MH33]PSK63072.1 HTH-type transcriptional repressor YvoA [Micromonospora sp. MH33]
MATKYDRIAADLRQRIKSGSLKPGERMPAETSLRDTYGVSLVTMRRALDQLAAEGLIEKRHGQGTFVRIPRQRIRRTTERYQWEKDRVLCSEEDRRRTGATERDTGLELADLQFEAEYRECVADEEVAEVFKIPAGTKLLERIYRTRSSKEVAPFGIGRSLLVYDVAAKNPELLDSNNEPWPGGTQHQLSTIGVELDRIVDEVTARPPSAEEALALGIDAGVAVLVLRKISIDTTDRVVEVADVVLAGDRTEMAYTTKLRPWSEAERKIAAANVKQDDRA